jgi:CheY-like chemotaxis protein
MFMEAKTLEKQYNSILLIDDNEIDLFIAESIVKSTAFAKRVYKECSGVNALNFLKSLTNEQDLPEIIFLDINMPVMDGFEFLKAFEALPAAIRKKPKIIMLSSSLVREEREKAMKFPSVIKYISKPLQLEDILDLEVSKV